MGNNKTFVENQIKELRDDFLKFKADFTEWQQKEEEKRLQIEQQIKPVLELVSDLHGTKKIIMYLIGGAASIGGTYLLIREIFFR